MRPLALVSVATSVALALGCGAAGETEPADDVPSVGDAADVSPADDGASVDVPPPRDAATPDLPATDDVPALDDTPAAIDVSLDVAPDLPRDVASDRGSDAGAPRDVPTPPDVPRPPDPTGAVQYPPTQPLSPMTEDLAAGLRAVVARGPSQQPRVFAKVGASNTVNTNFLHCFGGATTAVDLGGRDALRSTWEWFRAGVAAGTDPYRRTSVAATVGWSAWSALAGNPSPLAREITAITPRQAVVMFGTNDIQSRDIFRYGQNLLDIADVAMSRGVVPHFTTVPPRDDDPAANEWVPRYNAVVRAVAQARGVPFIDLHRELVPLPRHGLGGDGIHMNTYTPSGSPRGCVLTAAGLQYGFNTRNLITLQSLHRALSVTERREPAPDASAPRLRGEGTADSPYLMEQWPFGDLRDTSRGGSSRIARYTGCSATQDESGREFYYRVTLQRPTRVRAMVITRGTVDVDVHVLSGGTGAEHCVRRDDRLLVMDLPAGTHHLVLDTYASGGTPRAGEYLLVARAE